MKRIAVVDYGIGNIQSVINACGRVGVEARRATSGDELLAERDEAIILPGVGAIGEALAKLRENELETALVRRVIEEGTRFLGICVGMQMLGETCEEFGEHQALGWIPGRVRRLAPSGSSLRLPHVGWNTVEPVNDGWMAPVVAKWHFYFCHSYVFDCSESFVRARADYGAPFVAAVARDNISGVQFHPEKSSRAGEALLAAFLDG